LFRLLVACLLLTLPRMGLAEAPQLRDSGVLRVGASGDYAPFSLLRGGRFEGSDVELARRYARARGLRLEWVRFRWPELLQDLEEGRFDLAIGGVTVRPERSLVGRFSVPVAESGALVILPVTAPETTASLNRSGVRLGVNAGGHLEQVACARFPKARVMAITPNTAVRSALLEGRVDAIVSDTQEAPHWLLGTRGLRALPPFTRDRKAWLGTADTRDRMRDVDAWLLDQGDAGAPLFALVAALDERLDLMTWVAEAKRRLGSPVRVPGREATVLSAALLATREAAASLGRRLPDENAVETLFHALFAAARQVQETTLVGPPALAGPPDLATQLRPALSRISRRIAWLVARLQPPTHAQGSAEARVRSPIGSATESGRNFGPDVATLVEQLLDTPGLSEQSREALAQALRALR